MYVGQFQILRLPLALTRPTNSFKANKGIIHHTSTSLQQTTLSLIGLEKTSIVYKGIHLGAVQLKQQGFYVPHTFKQASASESVW
jgi:hypothetical protein